MEEGPLYMGKSQILAKYYSNLMKITFVFFCGWRHKWAKIERILGVIDMDNVLFSRDHIFGGVQVVIGSTLIQFNPHV